MKILGTVAKWVFMLCLPVLLLTASIGWAAKKSRIAVMAIYHRSGII